MQSESWSELLNPSPSTETTASNVSPPSLLHTPPYKVEENVKVTRQHTVDRLYTYSAGTLVEYPETSTTGRIGHLFELDPNNWFNPPAAFAYSQGSPGGKSKPTQKLYSEVLVDNEGKKVPCTVHHSTCMYS